MHAQAKAKQDAEAKAKQQAEAKAKEDAAQAKAASKAQTSKPSDSNGADAVGEVQQLLQFNARTLCVRFPLVVATWVWC